MEYFESMQIQMKFSWSIHTIESSEKKERLLQSESKDLVYIDSLTVKLSWSDPLYVSQNFQKDSLSCQVKPDFFDYDDEIEVSKEESK